MALAQEIMGGGFSSGAADAIQGGVNLTISAAGTTQGTATALKTSNNYISTAAASSGVILPAAMQGDWIVIYNGGANPVNVYPPTGAKINSLSTNGAAILAQNTACIYFCFSSTQWVCDLSA